MSLKLILVMIVADLSGKYNIFPKLTESLVESIFDNCLPIIQVFLLWMFFKGNNFVAITFDMDALLCFHSMFADISDCFRADIWHTIFIWSSPKLCNQVTCEFNLKFKWLLWIVTNLSTFLCHIAQPILIFSRLRFFHLERLQEVT